MKRIALLLIVIGFTASASQAQTPRGVIAEDATATWCVYCPDAYAGLEVMRNRYDATEFVPVRVYATSGDLGTTETDARISYYGVTGFPTVVFDGTTKVVGGSADIAAGNAYEPVMGSAIGLPSSLQIKINSVSLTSPTGSIDCDIAVTDPLADISNTKIRMVVCEDSVAWTTETMRDVTRDILPDVALTVSDLGQVQNVVQSFAVDPAWKSQDLWVAIFVQNDTDKSILQATSTLPRPAYSLRYWAKGPRGVVVAANSATFDLPEFSVNNLGTNSDLIHVALNPGTMPAGWSCTFSDGTTEYSSTDLALGSGEGQVFHLKVTPGASGYILPKIVLSTSNLPGVTREIPFVVVTNDVQMLLVDDDGGQSYDALHASALAAAGVTYGVWPTTVADATADVLTSFKMVDWEIGLAYPTLTAADRASITTFLNGGGHLFISGQDLGWEMNDNGGSSLTWYHTNLHANFVTDNAASNTVAGIAGDPIGAGMSMTLTAALNPYPDALSPYDSYATNSFAYGSPTGTRKAALKVDNGICKIVYLGFGYEAISTEANRNLLMQRVVTWLDPTAEAPAPPVSWSAAKVTALPNPARGGADLHYVLPQAGPAEIEIYGLDGSLVRRWLAPDLTPGAHILRWDGRDNGGTPVSSGVYFYRLHAGAAAPTGKLVLTR